MTIIRVHHETKYVVVSHEPFEDARLSWEARGLLGYLLSKPDGWKIRLENLKGGGKARDYKLRRMLKELKTCGYLHRERFFREDHTVDWITEIYESPSLNPHLDKDKE